MKCNNCNEEYDQELFEVCPYCLSINEEPRSEEDNLGVGFTIGDDDNCNEKCSEQFYDELVNVMTEETFNVGEDNQELTEDANDEVLIDDIAELGNRSKNVLHRTGIFTFGELRRYVKEKELSDIRYLGKRTLQEINDVIARYTTTKVQKLDGQEREIQEPEIQIRIEDISELSNRSKNALNRAGVFTLNKLIEFIKEKELSDIRYLGVNSKNEIMAVLENYIGTNESEQHRDINLYMFKHINEELQDLSIELLAVLGISIRTVHQLIDRGIIRIGQLKNISERALAQIVHEYNIDKFRNIECELVKSIHELLEAQLNRLEEDDEFQIALMKAEGFTLQDIGELKGVSRERIRQIIKKFNQKLNLLVEPLVMRFMLPKGYMKLQEILDIYDNDFFDKILVQWCKGYEKIEYLDFAEMYVLAGEGKHFFEEKILSIVSEFIGEGIDIYQSMEELDSILQKHGFAYLDIGDIINLVQKYGFRFYGDYVTQGRMSYSHVCAKIVANRFKNGIKLYDSKDLDLLRRYVLEEYGNIDIPEDNRTLSTRLSDVLVLCGRGAVIASENIQIEMSLLDEIKTFIDESPEGEFYYSNLYSEFEGMLQMMSNVDNYNFLHGVLMLYYPDDYCYTRDYLKKKGSGYLSGRLSDKISRFIKGKGQPTHKNDIMRMLSGMSDIVLVNAANTSEDLFMWDYNTYFSLDLLDYNDSDLNYLEDVISTIMDNHGGYCSDRLLYSYVQRDNSEFICRNQMTAENNLYYFCARTLGDVFDFRRPHIGKKGFMQEMSVKNVALYMLQNPDVLSYDAYATVAGQLMWAAVTTGMVFSEIEQGYVRISNDLYVKKDLFSVTKEELIAIETCVSKHMNHGFVSLMTVDFWDELPNIGYEWNGFLLHSVLIRFSKYYKIIEPIAKDRRFDKGIIVIKDTEIQDYMDVIIHLLKSLGKNEISEKDMTTLLIIHGLAYKMIPHEVYVSEKINYKDERFYIV